MSRSSLSRAARLLFVLTAVALLLVALVDQWSQVRRELADLGPLPVAGALLAVLAGLFASAVAWWEVLAALAVRLPLRAAVRVFFVGQLGKYVPGSVWPVLAQMEMGRDHGLARPPVGATAIVIMGLNVTTGLLTAAVTLPLTSPRAVDRYAWVLLVVPVGLAVLHPRVLTRLLNRVLRLLRRPSVPRPLTWRGVLTAAALAELMWLCYGAHVWLLAAALGAGGGAGTSWGQLAVLTLGAYALAWSAGFLFVISPAGVGVREAVLVFALSPVLPSAAATVVALVSRLAMMAGDLIWAGLAGRRRPAPLTDRRFTWPAVVTGRGLSAVCPVPNSSGPGKAVTGWRGGGGGVARGGAERRGP